jgi:peroxiredoxin
MPVLTAGKVAPPFELAGTDGKPYSLQAGLARGPIIAAFFKLNCPTCEYTLPFLERLYQQFRSHSLQVWGIAQDSARDSQLFAKEYGLTFPILIDAHNYEISRAYRLVYVPTIFLIGPDGRITISSEGFCRADLVGIHKSLAQTFSASPGALFQPAERVPEYKPG